MNHKQIQIVDKDDNVIGVATMDEAQSKGLRHRIVRIMVEDERRNILLQKRSAQMETSPNLWDHSAAGHVDDGETWEQAAKRELAEETGIKAKHMRELGTFKSNNVLSGRKLNRINKVFRHVTSSETLLKKDDEEVAELRWFSRFELQQLIKDQSSQITDGLKYVFEHYY